MPRRSQCHPRLPPLAAAVLWLCACSSPAPNGQAATANASAGTSSPSPSPSPTGLAGTSGVSASTAGAPAPTGPAAPPPPQPSAAGTPAAPASAGQAAAGSGGSPGAGAPSPAAGSGGSAGAAQAGANAEPQTFSLIPAGAMMLNANEYAFPANALPPTNESPEFTWTGVPAGAKSLALVFRDLTAGAVKWVIWDIPPMRTGIPSHVSNQAMPAEVPGSSQLGSLGNQGYAGPCCMQNQYEFVLWALDVDKLPGTMGESTVQLNSDVLPKHKLSTTKPIILRRTR